MLRRLLAGAAAGAAGTTALDAVTYLDMVVRARPASKTPEQTVERMAAAQGVAIPGEGSERQNRVTALGSLSGIAAGVGCGVAFGLLDMVHLRPRGLGGALLAGGGAMALANGGMVAYGVTDPRTWSKEDWVSDVVPHLVYGAVVSWTFGAATQQD